MRIIIDCNVLIAAGLKKGTCYEVLKKILQDHEIFCSEAILWEYAHTIKRAKFKSNFKVLKDLLVELTEIAEFVVPINKKINLPDKDDEIYIQAAFAAKADFLITGNRKHFPEKNYGKTKVVSPKEFLELVNKKAQK